MLIALLNVSAGLTIPLVIRALLAILLLLLLVVVLVLCESRDGAQKESDGRKADQGAGHGDLH